VIASIPSPSFNSLELGPLQLNLYGLMIAIGVVAAVWLFGRRLEARRVGTRDDASSIAVWAVLAGVIGSRLWHVATDWERFEGNLGDIPKIWNGGLGIPGGLILGIAVGAYMSRRRGIPIAVAGTCAAPAIPLAQAIGRWGNYFNQELYGGPTDLPWGLEITKNFPAEYAAGTLFHPTFLYESLWSLGLCLVLLGIDHRWRPAPGQLMVMYVIGYGLGRFWVEGLRIDPADEIGPYRFNQWVALVAVVGGTALLAWMRRHPFPEPASSVGEPDAGDAVEEVDGAGPGDEADPVAAGRAAEALDPDDDGDVGPVGGAVQERLGSELLDGVDDGVEAPVDGDVDVPRS
jgi:prolipoprotein diacylglyceryl transferase